MKTLNNSNLEQLKSEYATAVVENMTTEQVRSYVRQIIYNTVALEDGESVAKTIIKRFGRETYDEMIADALKRS
jgi:hypothetical protein